MTDKKEPTKLTLASDEAAMIFKQGEVPIILIPDQGDAEIVQDQVLQCAKLALALQDKEVMALIDKKFDEICNEKDNDTTKDRPLA